MSQISVPEIHERLRRARMLQSPEAEAPTSCEHPQYESHIEFSRLTEPQPGQEEMLGYYLLEVRVRCLSCKMDFRFEGTPQRSEDKLKFSVLMQPANELPIDDCTEVAM